MTAPDLTLAEKLAAFAELDTLRPAGPTLSTVSALTAAAATVAHDVTVDDDDGDDDGDAFDPAEVAYRRSSGGFTSRAPHSSTRRSASPAHPPRPTIVHGTPAAVLSAREGQKMQQEEGKKRRRGRPPRRHPASSASASPSSSSASRLAIVAETPAPVTGRKRRCTAGAVPSTGTLRGALAGLALFYVPDNDISPARRLRIAKAAEHGARRAATPADATHVVVDAGLLYGHVAVQLARYPAPAPTTVVAAHPVLVTADYPLDCIRFRSVLDPHQPQYSVPGCPADMTAAATAPLALEPGRQGWPDGGGPAASSNDARADRADMVSTASVAAAAADPESAHAQHAVQPLDDLSDAIRLMQRLQDVPLDEDGDEHLSPEREEDPAEAEVDYPAEHEQHPEQDHGQAQEQENKQDKDEAEYTESGSVSTAHRPDGEAHQNPAPSDSDSDVQSEGERERERELRRASRPRSPAVATRPGSRGGMELFACQRGGTLPSRRKSQDGYANARTVEILQAMGEYYTQTGDQWRSLAYRRATTTLRRQSVAITTETAARTLPGVGPRLAAKIAEIAVTDGLRRLDAAKADPVDGALRTFMGIYGVGTSLARRWIARGLRTLGDVRAHGQTRVQLTRAQRIGLDHYDDLNARIPRAEVEALAAVVRAVAAAIDPRVSLIVGGSYRRGAPSSGDVDFIVTYNDDSSASVPVPGTVAVAAARATTIVAATTTAVDLVGFLSHLVARLEADGVIVATLTSSIPHHQLTAGCPERGSDSDPDMPPALSPLSPSPSHQTRSGSKWHGCAVLPGGSGMWRRVDFLLVPPAEYGAGLIYFTGNDLFNRSIRLLASRRAMRLNQHGLFRDALRGPGRVHLTDGEKLESRDERRIFALLGVQWREPHERWC